MRPPDLDHCPSRPDAVSVLRSRARASIDRGDVAAIVEATDHEYGLSGLCLLALLQARLLIIRWGEWVILTLAPTPAVASYVSAVARDMRGTLSPDALAPEEIFQGFSEWGGPLVETLARIGLHLRNVVAAKPA